MIATMGAMGAENEGESVLLPELEVPEPPESQAGDEETVQTTVAHMRNALFYYRLVPILYDHIEQVEGVAVAEAGKVDVERRLKERALREVRVWKRRTIYTGSAAATLLIVSIVMIAR